MKFILGKKIGMTQMYDEKGRVVPVTLVAAGPCVVLQIKTKTRDGYEAAQIGYENKTKHIKKGEKGKEYKHLREWRPLRNDVLDIKQGDAIVVSVFSEGDKVKVSGVSKGKGFQGAVKKWGFHGRNATHGVKHEERTLGSVGCSFPEHVMKGRKMPGRMGAERVSVKNLKIVKIDAEKNLLTIKGAVPGRRGTVLEIRV